MPRNVTHGPDIVLQDVQRLTRVMRRVQSDQDMKPKTKKEVLDLLERLVVLMTENRGSSSQGVSTARVRTG